MFTLLECSYFKCAPTKKLNAYYPDIPLARSVDLVDEEVLEVVVHDERINGLLELVD